MYTSSAKVCVADNIKFEDFRDGKVLRNYVRVENTPKGGYYTDAVIEEQQTINDDKEMSLIDEGAMNPYEVYNSQKFLCSADCKTSIWGSHGKAWNTTGKWLVSCPAFRV